MSIKHLSELKPAQRAKADEVVRDALLAIVVAQGKPVVIPIDQLNQIAADHRLVVSVNPQGNLVTLTAESHAAQIVKEAGQSLGFDGRTVLLKGQAQGKTEIAGSVLQDPDNFNPRKPN